MELPKGERQPIQREVTGEIVYLNEMRAQGKKTQAYPSELTGEQVIAYEQAAEYLRQVGRRPPIMDEYDAYEATPDVTKQSCTQLAEVLHSLRRPDAQLTFVDIVVERSPQQVQEALKTMRAGTLLAADDKQLAFESDGSYYPVLDIQKKDATLCGVSLRVFRWTENYKAAYTNQSDAYSYPRDFLQYPADEKSHSYEVQLAFSYTHPASSFTESISLSIGGETDNSMRMSSQVWVAAYAETGYEGHNGKGLKNASNQDFMQFAGLVAEIVGDEPEAYWQRENRLAGDYLAQLPSDTARDYVQEWIDNTFAGQVIHTLNATKVGKVSLRQALLAGDPSAVELLKKLVDDRRAHRKQMIERRNDENDVWAKGLSDIPPWIDRVPRP